MLAAARSAHGTGIGRRLVASVEAAAREAGASEMQLELLVPTEGVQESKAVLAGWYSRAGYRRVSSKTMAEDYPELAVSLAISCDYQIWRKRLV
jgi:GNAT superfamily N-acetyltransferase